LAAAGCAERWELDSDPFSNSFGSWFFGVVGGVVDGKTMRWHTARLIGLAKPTPPPALDVTGGDAGNVVRTAAQKNAARQAALRERRAKAGLVPVTVFLPASVVADWKAAAAAAAARVLAGGSAVAPVLKCVKTGKLVKGGVK